MSDYRYIYIVQGGTFSKEFNLENSYDEPLDTTGMTCYAQMKRNYDSANTYDFTASVNNSIITISMSPDDTVGLDEGRYVYDVFLEDSSNNISRPFYGVVTVKASVTRI